MQNCLVSFKNKVCKLLEKANKCAPNFFSHLETHSFTNCFFLELLEMLLPRPHK